MRQIVIVVLLSLISWNMYSQERDTTYLWPGLVPGEREMKHKAVEMSDHSRDVTRLTDITDPVFIAFKPNANNNNGTGIIVCPGGGYRWLAIDIEGYEVAAWLNKQGYTAFVLQYRVPDKQEGALQDIQRAIRVIRKQADKWSINPDKLGVLGFSAGGSLCARVSTEYDKKTYSRIDKSDSLSCKPDFSLLIYPAYLDKGSNRSLTPELKVNKNTPPMFIFATSDDLYSNSALVMTTALRDANVPVELHMLPSGGHGYGLRAGNPAADIWPQLAEKWLNEILTN